MALLRICRGIWRRIYPGSDAGKPQESDRRIFPPRFLPLTEILRAFRLKLSDRRRAELRSETCPGKCDREARGPGIRVIASQIGMRPCHNRRNDRSLSCIFCICLGMISLTGGIFRAVVSTGGRGTVYRTIISAGGRRTTFRTVVSARGRRIFFRTAVSARGKRTAIASQGRNIPTVRGGTGSAG